MTVKSPDIQDAKLTDTENGVTLSFRLDEGLEESNELSLWVRARIRGSDYYQPLDLNILPDNMAEATIEPGKIQDGDGAPYADVEWYMEAYPSREKSAIVKKTLAFDPDWYGLPAEEKEIRSSFERMGVEAQANEAARYRLVAAEETLTFPTAALDTQVGLWVVMDGDDTVGIAPNQPDMGYKWIKPWFPQVLERSREIRTENGWDDGETH